jgi:hypothetical protein
LAGEALVITGVEEAEHEARFEASGLPMLKLSALSRLLLLALCFALVRPFLHSTPRGQLSSDLLSAFI